MNDSTRAISGDGRCGAGPHLLPRHPPDTPEPEPPLAASARARSTTYPAAPPKRRSQISPNITSFGLAEVYKSRARRGKTAHHAEPCVTRWLNRYRWNPILASWKRLTSETREPDDAPHALQMAPSGAAHTHERQHARDLGRRALWCGTAPTAAAPARYTRTGAPISCISTSAQHNLSRRTAETEVSDQPQHHLLRARRSV